MLVVEYFCIAESHQEFLNEILALRLSKVHFIPLELFNLFLEEFTFNGLVSPFNLLLRQTYRVTTPLFVLGIAHLFAPHLPTIPHPSVQRSVSPTGKSMWHHCSLCPLSCTET